MFLKENKVFIIFSSFFFTYEILAKCTLFEQKIVGHLTTIQVQGHIEHDILKASQHCFISKLSNSL